DDGAAQQGHATGADTEDVPVRADEEHAAVDAPDVFFAAPVLKAEPAARDASTVQCLVPELHQCPVVPENRRDTGAGVARHQWRGIVTLEPPQQVLAAQQKPWATRGCRCKARGASTRHRPPRAGGGARRSRRTRRRWTASRRTGGRIATRAIRRFRE